MKQMTSMRLISSVLMAALSIGQAQAGATIVDTPDPVVSIPVPVVALPVTFVAAIISVGTLIGETEAAGALTSALPGSPEAIAAVNLIIEALADTSVGTNGTSSLSAAQQARARDALARIIQRSGNTPALDALLAGLQ